MSSFLRALYFFNYAFSAITLKILNSYNKSLQMFASHIFGPKRCLYPICHVEAVQDVLFSKTVPIRLHHTVNVHRYGKCTLQVGIHLNKALARCARQMALIKYAYSVKQSDRNSSKTDLFFYKPTTFEQHVQQKK